MTQITECGCFELMRVLVTREAVFGWDHAAIITAALERVLHSMGSHALMSAKVYKNMLCPFNQMYHAWKDHCTSPVLTPLGLRSELNQPLLSKEDITRKVTNLLVTFSYLWETPGNEYFTANYFIQMVTHKVFKSMPLMYVHINQAEPCSSLNNLFALGAATIVANIQDYLEGTLNTQEVSPQVWRANYHATRTLIEEMQWDTGWHTMLDMIQMWIMVQGTHLVRLSRCSCPLPQ